MPPRTIVALAAGLAVLGASLTAAVAAPAHRAKPHKRAPITAHAAGVVADWDPGAAVVAIDDPEVWGAPRAVRRAVRRGAGVELAVGPRTRIVAQAEDGGRERISAADLFDELDQAGDDVEIEVAGRVVPGALPGPDRMVDLTATRVVVHLPPVAEDGSDLGDDPGSDDPGFDDPGDLPPDDESPEG